MNSNDERLLLLLRGLEVDEKAISYLLSHPPYHCGNLGKDISKHCHRINTLLEKYFREELARDAIDLVMKNSIPVD